MFIKLTGEDTGYDMWINTDHIVCVSYAVEWNTDETFSDDTGSAITTAQGTIYVHEEPNEVLALIRNGETK